MRNSYRFFVVLLAYKNYHIKNKMNKGFINTPVSVLTGFLLVFAILFLLLQRVDTYIKYKGIDDCGKISRYEKVDQANNFKVYYPLQNVFNECMKQKGLSK